MLKPCLKNLLRPLYKGLSGILDKQARRTLLYNYLPVHPGDSEEGLNRRGARDLVISNAIAMQQRRDSDQTAQQSGNMGKALGSGNTGQFCGPKASKATYRRVLIGVVHAT